MTCPHCRGLLHQDDLGLLVCWACGREANPPAIMPVDKWPDGVQPAVHTPKPRSGNHDAIPPPPSHPWREDSSAHWAQTKAAQLELLRRQEQAKKNSARRATTYREQLRRLVMGKPTGKTHVAPRLRGRDT